MNLKEKLAGTDTDRFVEIYDTHYSLIFNSVYSKVGNYHDAEDICQEVFIRYYDSMESVENPRRWLFGCLRNVVFDYYKMNKNRSVDIDELFDDISLGYVNGFRDVRIMIKQAVDEICEERGGIDASLFELVAVYNYTFVQASRHLNMNYKQARYRYNVFAGSVLDRLRQKGVKNIEDLL